jgi:hypothetical protein
LVNMVRLTGDHCVPTVGWMTRQIYRCGGSSHRTAEEGHFCWGCLWSFVEDDCTIEKCNAGRVFTATVWSTLEFRSKYCGSRGRSVRVRTK